MRCLVSVAAAAALIAFPASADDPSPAALSLAKQVVDLSGRKSLTRDTWAKELHAGMTFCKGEQKCQVDLDRAILLAASEVSEKYADSMTQILARKLNVKQLNAALEFYQTPDGQAIAEAESQLSDEMAQIAFAAQASSQRIISESFCPSHPDICVNDVGRHPPTRPKS
jgi:hypothetical protein